MEHVASALSAAGVNVHVLPARSSNEAEDLCRQAVSDAAAALVAVGGDGTVHRALQAVANTPVALGVVPVGSGNDFASAVGLSTDVSTATSDIVAALTRDTVSRETVSLDLLQAVDQHEGRRWCATVLAAGLDALIADRANRMPLTGGWMRYQVAIGLEMARLQQHNYRLRIDGESHHFAGPLLAIGNTRQYGAGARICPNADPQDGQLDVCYGQDMGRLTVARLRGLVYRGTHLSHPDVYALRGRKIEVAGPKVVSYADGEPSLRLPLEVTCVPDALRLLSGRTSFT